MNSSERILVLDGHTNQALACVRSLGQAGYSVLVASHQRSPLGKWSRYSRESFRLAGQSVEAFVFLREWAHSRGVQIVLPLTERSCVLTNVEREEWEAAGMLVGCGPNEMLLHAFDKGQTIKHAMACGVRIPPTRFPGSLSDCFAAVDELGFPVIVKSRWSNAWDGATFSPRLPPAYINHRDDLTEAVSLRRQRDDWPLIQGFVGGTGKGVFALCDRGRAVAWFAHERLRDTRPTGSSSSLRRSIRLDARLREPAERMLWALNWHGPAMVEFKDDGVNAPCLMEVNGRFWGSLQLGIDAGINFPLLWVSLLKDQAVERIGAYAEGVVLRWVWGDVKRFIRIVRGAPRGFPGAYPTIGQGIKELLGPQPAGTRLEILRKSDPWPAVGEWVGGLREFIAWRYGRVKRTGWRKDEQSEAQRHPVNPVSDVN